MANDIKESLNLAKRILSLNAYRVRPEDPTIPLNEKHAKREFVAINIAPQHIKYAKCCIKSNKIIISTVHNSPQETDFLSCETTESISSEIRQLSPSGKVILGLNDKFGVAKIYPPNTTLDEIQLRVEKDIADAVGTQSYQIYKIRDQYLLIGIEKDRINRAIQKATTLGLTPIAVYSTPCALLERIAEEDLEWQKPGLLLYYHQNMALLLGWTGTEIFNAKASQSIRTARGGNAGKSALSDLQTEIIKWQRNLKAKTQTEVTNFYIHDGDTTDQTIQLLKNQIQPTPQDIKWLNLLTKTEFLQENPKDIDLACPPNIKDLQPLLEIHKNKPPAWTRTAVILGYILILIGVFFTSYKGYYANTLYTQAKQARIATQQNQNETTTLKEREQYWQEEIQYKSAVDKEQQKVKQPDTFLKWAINSISQRNRAHFIQIDYTLSAIKITIIIEVSEGDKIPDSEQLNAQLDKGNINPPPIGFTHSTASISTQINPRELGIHDIQGDYYKVTYLLLPIAN